MGVKKKVTSKSSGTKAKSSTTPKRAVSIKTDSKKSKKDYDVRADEYDRPNDLEHIMTRPDTYVGNINPLEEMLYVCLSEMDTEGNLVDKFVQKNVTRVPAAVKVHGEIVENAGDQATKLLILGDDNPVTRVEITVTRPEQRLTVFNDGLGIPIIDHKSEKHDDGTPYLIPEAVFSLLRAGSNHQNKKVAQVGGRNGYGATLTNIFSKEFTVTTVDHKLKKKFTQTWRCNMEETDGPKVTNYSGKPYTEISYILDFDGADRRRRAKERPYKCKKCGWDTVTSAYLDKHTASKCEETPEWESNIASKWTGLNMPNGMDDDFISLVHKKTYDLAACTDPSVKVYYKGPKDEKKRLIKVRQFSKYMDMYIGSAKEARRQYLLLQDKNKRYTWELGVAMSSDEKFRQTSFVNSIETIHGGTHVKYITNELLTALCDKISKMRSITTKIEPKHIERFLWIFLKTEVPDPSFNTQTKEVLTSNKTERKFDLMPGTFDDSFLNKILNMGLKEAIILHAEYRDKKNKSVSAAEKKTDGTMTKNLTGIPKLVDADIAGVPSRKEKATIIFTEGDSAKALAVAGLLVVGRKTYGVFPLRGKMVNVTEMDAAKITNQEIVNIKKIIGLKSGVDYKDTKTLRYDRIMIMTDQDTDGSHIKALLTNVFRELWPSLFSLPGFICSLITPIVKATKGKQSVSFKSIKDYEDWKEGKKGWTIKYYKGLATSTANEAKEYFKNLDENVTDFEWTEKSNVAYDMVLHKKKADARKEWLMTKYDRNRVPDYKKKKIRYEDFVNDEYIHHAMADNMRSLPSLDGLKDSKRKILYYILGGRSLKGLPDGKEIKVAALAAGTVEPTDYHHGEASLQATIIGMAQTYVGSNNINLLEPIGQFGTRPMGGSDAGSPRYIFTMLNPLIKHIFIPEDNHVLDHLIGDNDNEIEPEMYYPIIPMLLVNGGEGIGTGYSSQIPSYNPIDLMNWIRARLTNKKLPKLKPWYRWFKGDIEYKDPEKPEMGYKTRGKLERTGDDTVIVTELPLGFWTDDFEEFIDSCIGSGDDYSSMTKEDLQKMLKEKGVDAGIVNKRTKKQLVTMLESIESGKDPLSALAEDKNYSKMTVGTLKELLKERQIDIPKGSRKAAFVALLKDDDGEDYEALAKVSKKGKKTTSGKKFIKSRVFENYENQIWTELTFNSKKELDDLMKDDKIYDELKLVESKKCGTTNMHYLVSDKICKSNDITEIFELYFEGRKKKYAERKEFLLKMMEKELIFLKFKYLFLQCIIPLSDDSEPSLVLSRRDKSKNIELLENGVKHKGKIIKFPKLSKPTDINNEEPQNYDYLLKMTLGQLSLDEMERLKKLRDNKQAEYDDLKNKTVATMWMEELDTLEVEYNKYLERLDKDEQESIRLAKENRDKDDDDDDDDKKGKSAGKKQVKKPISRKPVIKKNQIAMNKKPKGFDLE